MNKTWLMNKDEIRDDVKVCLADAYGPIIIDSGCGLPISWGYKVVQKLPEGVFEQVKPSMVYSNGEWFYATKKLTPDEAIEIYGPITLEEKGPRGGFLSVTYGETKFTNRQLRPKVENGDKESSSQ